MNIRNHRPATLRILIAVGLMLVAALALAVLPDLQASFQPTPTPATLAPLRAGPAATEAPSIFVVPPVGVSISSAGRPKVRLRRDVMVHTAPSADSPRPAISVLGAGMLAEVVETQDDWILIEFGPLRGWTPTEAVDPVG